MSYLKDLFEAPDGLKEVLVQFFMMPFWTLTIYLFNPEFYYKNDLFLIMVLAGCLTLSGSLIFTLLIGALDVLNVKSKEKLSDSSEITVFLHIGYISLTLFSSWLYFYITGSIFLLFTYLCFHFGLLVLILILLVLISFFIKSKKQNL